MRLQFADDAHIGSGDRELEEVRRTADDDENFKSGPLSAWIIFVMACRNFTREAKVWLCECVRDGTWEMEEVWRSRSC